MAGRWAIMILGLFTIFAAVATQICTLAWRNWVTIGVRNTNCSDQIGSNISSCRSMVHIGLWGCCVSNIAPSGYICIAFHGNEGKLQRPTLPWHLQATIFFAMICVCCESLGSSLCLVELIYRKVQGSNNSSQFPLKRLQLFLGLVSVLLSFTMATIMAILVVSGYEQEMWSILRERIPLLKPARVGPEARFSLSQAWGFQALSIVYLSCYLFICRVQSQSEIRMTIATGTPQGRVNRARLTVVSPGCTRNVRKTPPPAYSPPPGYDQENEPLKSPSSRETERFQDRIDAEEDSGSHGDSARNRNNRRDDDSDLYVISLLI